MAEEDFLCVNISGQPVSWLLRGVSSKRFEAIFGATEVVI
jgi:hypothetical protein